MQITDSHLLLWWLLALALATVLALWFGLRARRKQQRALGALRASEEKRAIAFRSSPDAITITRARDGRIVEINDGFTELCGYTRAEAIGRSTLELGLWVRSEDRDHFLRELQVHGRIRNLDLPIRTKGGAIRQGQLAAELIELDGEPHLIAVTRDRTEHHETQAQLQMRLHLEEVVARLATRFISLPRERIDAAVVEALGEIGRFAEADRAYLDLVDHERDEFTVSHEWCGEGVPPFPKSVPLAAFAWSTERLRQGQPVHLEDVDRIPAWATRERELLRAAGVRSQLLLPLQREGKLVGCAGFDSTRSQRSWSEESIALLGIVGRVLLNVLLRKKAEEALVESERRFQVLAEAAFEGILISRDGGVLDASQQMADMLGCEHAELVGRVAADLLAVGCREEFARRLDAAEGEPFEAQAVTGDGRPLPIEVCVRAMPYRGHRVRVAVVRDMTAHKQAERALVAYQQRLRSLATELGLAEERVRRDTAVNLHDSVGQSLTAAKLLLAQLGELSDSGPGRELVSRAENMIEQTIEQTRSIVFQLSPPILYELGFEPAVRWLAEDLFGDTQVQFWIADDQAAKPLELETKVMLFQMLREVLLNVVKHAAANRVVIRLLREGEHIAVEIEDDGVGFEPTRALANASGSGGFGLFSIRERLNALGGSLRIDSGASGTRVRLDAPLGASREPRASLAS